LGEDFYDCQVRSRSHPRPKDENGEGFKPRKDNHTSCWERVVTTIRDAGNRKSKIINANVPKCKTTLDYKKKEKKKPLEKLYRCGQCTHLREKEKGGLEKKVPYTNFTGQKWKFVENP